jgi:YEATS family
MKTLASGSRKLAFGYMKHTLIHNEVSKESLSDLLDDLFLIDRVSNTSVLAIEQPPFEVSETGWGEFEIAIKIYFHTASGEKPVTLYHHLRLHPYEDDGTGQPWPKEKPVTSFNYDEVVSAFRQIVPFEDESMLKI